MQDEASSAVNFYRCLCSAVSGGMSKESIVRLRSVYIERQEGGLVVQGEEATETETGRGKLQKEVNETEE